MDTMCQTNADNFKVMDFKTGREIPMYKFNFGMRQKAKFVCDFLRFGNLIFRCDFYSITL